MKKLNQLLLISLLGSSLLGFSASAEKMNSETQDLVIKKMERVLSEMEKTDSSWLPSQQRLADLLAERARTRFMQEIEANCDGCKGSKADRQQAIQIYESLLKDININEHGPILFQLAHLYEMAGKNDQAQKLFESIIKDAKKKKIAPLLVAKSQMGLADMLFQKNKFKEARVHYIAALKEKNLDGRTLAIYNKAWCEFNQDQLDQAIKTLENLLARPQQITRDTDETSVYDPVFHADIMRDLATFYSRRTITDREINRFDELAPKEKRKELLLGFSEEADRLGQKKAAHTILNKYMEDKSLTKEEKLNAFVNMAQVNYDRGQTTQSTQDFAKAAAAYQDTGCDTSAKCLELQKTMKRYVTELHRSKKVKPDQDLLTAYQIYARTFPSDKEMIQRGAQVSVEMGQYATGIQFYRMISSNRAYDKKDKDEALLNEVGAAEKSNDFNLKKESYIHFIKNSSNEQKRFEVSYQLAYLHYQNKQLKEAAVYFYDLAKDKSGQADLRKKSADLSLDALAQIKDDVTLEQWAWEYADVFTKNQREYETIARRALMNRVARLANDKNTSKADLSGLLKTVLKTRVNGASAQEKMLFYTNVGVLAQKVDDSETYVKSQQLLLQMKELSKDKKQALLEQLASYYEQRLDFKQAYNFAVQIRNKKTKEFENEFRLGTLADLGGLSAERHYRNSLKTGLSGSRSLIVRSRLVLLSANPVAELKKQAPQLRQKPDLLNDTVLFVYAKTENAKALRSILEMKELRHESAPHFVQSQDYYERITAFYSKIATLQLNSKSTKSLQRTLGERTAQLAKADKFLNESLSIKDITAQMLALNLVTRENERLVKDLAAIPAPKGLNTREQAQYTVLFKAKLRPFLYKSKMAQQKMQEVWDSSPAIAQLTNDYKVARPEIQKILVRELHLLSQVPGEGRMKVAVQAALNTSPASTKDLLVARQAVSENPNDAKELAILRDLETKMGHPLMPSYIEARLNHLQKGDRL